LAVDPGSRRVGLAISDEGRVLANPLEVIAADPPATLVDRLADAARRHQARHLVVGLPVRLDGSRGPEALAARELGDRLRTATGLPVTMVDERLTTAQAERELLAAGERRRRRRAVTDSVAAALILQTFLDRHGG
jgi:putative Holliday junction resolvase